MAGGASPPPPPLPGGRGHCRLLFLLLLLLRPFSSRVGRGVAAAAARAAQPRCHTDLATEVVCCWQAPPPPATCAEAFRLRYHTNSYSDSQVCLPSDRRGSGPCPLCTCAVPAQDFHNVQFHFALDRHTLQNWTEIWSITKEALNLDVKPLPLVNLTVVNKSHLFVLTWEKDRRANIFYMTKINYEVAYWLKGQEKLVKCSENEGISSCPGSCWTLDTKPPCFAVRQEFSEITSSYEIYAHQLTPHSDYVASMRYRLDHWGGTWSEWSSPCTWHNGLEPRDHRWKVIPWLCVPVVVVILICYVCLGRVKKWQDSIPHPVIVIGKQISSLSFSENGKRPSPHGVKALLCDLCNRGKKSHDRNHPKAFSGQRVEWKIPRGEDHPPRTLVLHPEDPVIERSPIRCSQETEIEPEMPLEETNSPPEAPHADTLMASLFRNAVRAWDTRVGPELSVSRQGAPDMPPHAPCLDSEGSPRMEAVEGSSESGHLSSNVGSAASLWVVGPVPHQGASWGPSIPEEASQGSLLWPHGPPGAPAGGFSLQKGGPVGGLPLTASGYKSFSSLSQPTDTFHQAWEEEEEEEEEEPLLLLPGGQQIQFPLPDGGSNSSLPLGPGLCSQQLPFPGGQDSYEDGLMTVPSPPALTPAPKDPWTHTSPGYRPLSSLLPKGPEAQGPISRSGPEPPYKPLNVLRSGATKPLGGGTLSGHHLGGERTTEMSTWPGTFWGSHLGLSQDLGSLEEGFPGQRGLSAPKGLKRRNLSCLRRWWW